MTDELPDGVYIGLPEEEYFAQKRLGSTDLAKLHTHGAGWWWSSFHNPDYVAEPEDAKPRIFGKALHALVLEGEEAFRERFAVIETKEEARARLGDALCVTTKDILTQLEKRGMHPKANESKAFFINYCRTRAPDLVIWDVLEQEWQERNAGKLPISSAEERQLGIMRNALLEHQEVGSLFRVTPENRPLVELSVLYTDEHGLKRRIRYDDALPNAIVDVKAISNVGGGPLVFSVGEHVAKYAYYVQAADHRTSWKWMLRLVAEGKVYGGSEEDRAWINRFPKEANAGPEYVWIFFQRPDSKNGRAPVIFPWAEDWGSDLHVNGIRARRRAIQSYLQLVAQFGLDKPWTVVEPVHTTTEGYPHRVFVPHWTAQEPVPEEQDEL